jgi:hypothetical protein
MMIKAEFDEFKSKRQEETKDIFRASESSYSLKT